MTLVLMTKTIRIRTNSSTTILIRRGDQLSNWAINGCNGIAYYASRLCFLALLYIYPMTSTRPKTPSKTAAVYTLSAAFRG